MLKELLKLAAPSFVAQMAIMLNSVVDTVMAGNLSATDQAAVGLGASIYVTVYIAFTGVILALSPIAGQHFGAKRYHEIGADFRQAVVLALGLSVLAIALLLATPLWIAIAKPPPDVAHITHAYLLAVAAAAPANLLFRAYSALNNAISRPSMVMLINLVALALKIPLNYLFMYGGSFELFGVSIKVAAYGGAGCGIATCVVFWLMVIAGIYLLATNKDYARYQLFGSFKPDWQRLSNILKIGVPIGLSYMIEISSFTFIAVFLARNGAQVTAAHQIVSNVAGVMYMVALSLAIASSTLTAQSIGAQSAQRVRASIRVGTLCVVVAALATSLLVFLGRFQIARFYSNDVEVIQLAALLLVWVAIFHILDASQTIIAFILRAFKITSGPMLVYAIALWGIGLGGGTWLAYSASLPWLPPAQSYWSASILANTVAVLGLWWVGAQKVRAVIRQLGN